MKRQKGSITIPADTSPWDHELKTAHALTQYGLRIEFIPESTRHRAKTAYLTRSNHPSPVECPPSNEILSVLVANRPILYLTRRMKYVPDKSIQKELVKQFKLTKDIEHLLFVNRKQEVIDISTLI
jgi:hypothetical protein